MRIILYTGKGGVGKTSVAAATALRAAELGYKTVVLSTDIAHSLADSFDLPLGPDPVPVAQNLWGQEIDIYRELDRYWATIQDWITALLRWQGVEEVMAEELAVLPGMEELVGLLYIARYHDQGNYDVLVVDCAPTGETIRLLSFPDVARWYMNRLFPIQRMAVTTLGPVAHRLIGMPVPDQRVFTTLEGLYNDLEKMRAILTDGDNSSVRLVVNAEKMVIKEARRTFTYLNLYGYYTDLVVCNRVLPQAVGDNYFNAWKESQARYLQLIEESFAPIPILTAPLMAREVVGLDALRELAHHIFGDDDPTRVAYRGSPLQVTRDGRGHMLKITLPFVTGRDISLLQTGDELVIHAGPYRRMVYLPRALANLPVGEAELQDHILTIRFQEPQPSQPVKRKKSDSRSHSGGGEL